jgi:hypothetical protein
MPASELSGDRLPGGEMAGSDEARGVDRADARTDEDTRRFTTLLEHR